MTVLSRRLGWWAAALLVVIVGATAFGIYRNAEHEVLLEVTSTRGQVSNIQWAAPGTKTHVDGPVQTPWSMSITTTRPGALVTVAVLTAETDAVTCRITVDGEVRAESTDDRATGCAAHLGLF